MVKNQELSIRKASEQFGIPYGTLGDKVRGRRPLNWNKKGKFIILEKLYPNGGDKHCEINEISDRKIIFLYIKYVS